MYGLVGAVVSADTMFISIIRIQMEQAWPWLTLDGHLCDGPLLSLGFKLLVGMKVWYGGAGFFCWLLAFIHVLCITFKQLFSTEYIVLTFSIDAVSTFRIAMQWTFCAIKFEVT